MKLAKGLAVVVALYLVFAGVGFLSGPNYVGAIGRTPFGLLGHKSSIIYLYDCFSYENYNERLKLFWLRKGALEGIPEFQRLYGGKLLEDNAVEGVRFLREAANSGDYYAAAFLASIYEDEKFNLKDADSARKYRELARQLRQP